VGIGEFAGELRLALAQRAVQAVAFDQHARHLRAEHGELRFPFVRRACFLQAQAERADASPSSGRSTGTEYVARMPCARHSARHCASQDAPSVVSVRRTAGCGGSPRCRCRGAPG
jgi:hypothetical protein